MDAMKGVQPAHTGAVRAGAHVQEVGKVGPQPERSLPTRGAEHATETGQKAAISPMQGSVSTLESTLPMGILQSPALMRSEWAWRRLLTDLVQSNRAAVPAADAETEPLAHPSHVPALRVPTSGNAYAAPGARGDTLVENPVATQPLPLLKSSIDVLWLALSRYGSQSKADQSAHQVTVPTNVVRQWPLDYETSDGKLLTSFSHWEKKHVNLTRHGKVEDWVIADRLTASVRTSESPVGGSGAILFPASANSAADTQVVRWEAERHTKRTAAGETFHRIVLHVLYDSEPVDIHLTCAKPMLSVHISTNHRGLQHRLTQSKQDVVATLNGAGWDVFHWSVASRGDED